MKKFSEWIETLSEGFEKIDIQGRPVDLYVNPSLNQLTGWMIGKERYIIRGIKTMYGDKIFWPAGQALHDSVAKIMGTAREFYDGVIQGGDSHITWKPHRDTPKATPY